MTTAMGLFILLFASVAGAQGLILVEAPRLIEEAPTSSPEITVIDRSLLERSNKVFVADVLRDVPGLEVVRQGAFGQTTSVFIRGSRSESVLVLLDGIEMNDALSPSGGFDFSNLSTMIVERIEIYRGPQTVRFGPGASGGVIQVITRDGTSSNQADLRLEAGSYGTKLAELGGTRKFTETFGVTAGLQKFAADGFSAADRRQGNSEIDSIDQTAGSAKFSWRPDRVSAVDLVLHHRVSFVDSDLRGGPGGDDPNDTNETRQLLAGLKGSRRFIDGRLRSTLGYFYGKTDRTHSNFADAFSNSELQADFTGENHKVESETEWLFDDENGLRLNLQWKSENGESKTVADGQNFPFERHEQFSTGEGLTYFNEGPMWFGEAGLRSDQHSQVGTVPTYRALIGRRLTRETTLRLTGAKGLKAPSLYQLYSEFGNSSLNFETNESLELSVEQRFLERNLLSIAVFRNQHRDLIDFDSALNQYFNVSRVETRGLETQLHWGFSNAWSARLDATYLEAYDQDTGRQLARRPKYTANAEIRYVQDRWEGTLQDRFQGARNDTNPLTFQSTELPAYDVVDVLGEYQLNSFWRLTGRIENLFNRGYQEVAGYGTPELSFFLGIKGRL